MARLRLYDMLDRVGQCLAYCDTDSVVYIADEEAERAVEPYLGNMLGQFSDELDGDKIKYWLALASKDYCYKTERKKYVSKVKGFRNDSEHERKTSRRNREKLLKGQEKAIEKNQINFKLTRENNIIVSDITKTWKCTTDKRVRVIVSEWYIDSVPYGY